MCDYLQQQQQFSMLPQGRNNLSTCRSRQTWLRAILHTSTPLHNYSPATWTKLLLTLAHWLSGCSGVKFCFIFPRKLLGALSQGAKLKCTKWESLSFRNGCNYTVLVFVAMSSRYNYFCKYSGTRHPPPVNGAAPLAASSRLSWYYLPSTWRVSISQRIVPN